MLSKISTNSTCLILQATQPTCRYVVVRQASGKPSIISAGSFDYAGGDLAEQSTRILDSHAQSASRVVLLLPRGEVEVNSLRLPPATDEERPELVANMILQQADDASVTTVTDFILCHEADDGSHDALSFSVAQDALQQLQKQFKQQNMRLVSVTFGGIGAVSLLNQVSNHPARTSIVVTTTDQDTDLAVVESGKPLLFRTIPRATGGEQFVIDQLADDIQRTLTLVGHPDEEDIRVYLIGTINEQEDAAKSLSEKLSVSVSLVNPFDQVQGKVSVDKPSRFANLIGIASSWNEEQLSVDLLNPRKPPTPPSLWSRYGFWASVAASLLALGGYLWWEQAENQRIELQDQQAQLQTLIKPVKRAQTRQAMAKAVNDWRATEISWLDELLWLSKTLPPADQATVGTLTLTSGASNVGQIDLPLVVSESNVRMKLEEAARDGRHSIRSKRVIDASNPATPAWRFNSTITVAASSPAQLQAETAEAEAPTPDGPAGESR